MKKKKKEKTREKTHMVHKKDTLLINLSNFIHTHIHTHTYTRFYFLNHLSSRFLGFALSYNWVFMHSGFYRTIGLVALWAGFFYLGFTAL